MSDPRLYEWIALRRVQEGGVAKSAGVYLDHGRPVRSHLTEVFDRLTWTGLVAVAAGDPLWELRQLSLTHSGQVRYTALSQQRQRVTLPVPSAGFRAQPCPGSQAHRQANSDLPAEGRRHG